MSLSISCFFFSYNRYYFRSNTNKDKKITCFQYNFSFVGLPPLAGFFGKQMVLTSALDNNNTMLVIIAILTSVIGAVYYLNVVKKIYFNKTDYKKSYLFVEVTLSNYLSISIAILTLGITLFILMPNEPLNLCSLLASSLSETINFY